jgi:hypothetical protein
MTALHQRHERHERHQPHEQAVSGGSATRKNGMDNGMNGIENGMNGIERHEAMTHLRLEQAIDAVHADHAVIAGTRRVVGHGARPRRPRPPAGFYLKENDARLAWRKVGAHPVALARAREKSA